VESLPGVVYQVDVTQHPDGSMTTANAFVAGNSGPAFLSTNAEAMADIENNTWFDWYDERTRGIIIAGIREAIMTGETVMEYSVTHLGKKHSFRNSARCTRRWDNAATICGYAWSIDNEQALLERLSRSTTLAGLGAMAAGLMHELNQPLAIINLLATNAAANLDAPTPNVAAARVKLDRVSDQAMRAAEVVKYVRQLGRGDRGMDEAIDVAGSIEQVMMGMQGRLRHAGVKPQVALAPGLGQVSGPPVAFQQVLMNLIANAIDAYDQRVAVPGGGDRGGAEPQRPVVIAATRNGPVVKITVADQAGGISPKHIGDIFNPFFTTKDVGMGTGLGLALAHRTVLAMRGTIEVANVDGGARFAIFLPAIAWDGDG
jgi:signal transduction histidine kinase